MSQPDFQNIIGMIVVSLTVVGFGAVMCYKFGPDKTKEMKK